MRAALLLTLLFFSSCREVILHDLEEGQANQIWVALQREKISAIKSKESGGWSIAVSSGHSVAALELLEELKLPRAEKREKLTQSFLPTKDERELIKERQLATTLEQTFMSLPGVADARVHLVLPQTTERFTGSEKRASSASVLIVVEQGRTIDAVQIRELVAGASAIPKESVAVAVASWPVKASRVQSPEVKPANLDALSAVFPSFGYGLAGLAMAAATIKTVKRKML